MNALIFTEDSNLHIIKENGLRFNFDNVPKPNLGFDFDVVIYDDRDEFKIVNYDDSKPFDDQERERLEDSERDAIEMYIRNSEPPQGVSLANQHCDDLQQTCDDRVNQMCGHYRFRNLEQVVYAGREGSNHPFRSDARKVMEYADGLWTIFIQIVDEIQSTREDHLRDVSHYIESLPTIVSIGDET